MSWCEAPTPQPAATWGQPTTARSANRTAVFRSRRSGKGTREPESRGGSQLMQQLTSLDAQFLAIETPRTYGHVGGLCIYDPSTAPGGDITHADLCRLGEGRLHLPPPFTRKLVPVPFGLDQPYWIEDPAF